MSFEVSWECEVSRTRATAGRALRAAGLRKPLEQHEPTFLDLHAKTAPSTQLAVDIFAGDWSSHLPNKLGVVSGSARLFEDPRIAAVIDWYGPGIVGARVLELGPLEGGHTAMLDQAGAEVLAIESNSQAFLKCLVVKELLDLRRSRFVRGDFTEYLRGRDHTFDLLLASGVLYHMVDPVGLLELLASASDHLAIWTHYYREELVRALPTSNQFGPASEPYVFADARYVLHPRQYHEAVGWSGFCGGTETYAQWMERDDINDCLTRLGFTDIEVAFDQPEHPNGPSILLMARR